MIADFLLLITIIFFLFLVEPVATLFAIIFFSLTGLVYYFFTKRVLFNWGERRLNLEAKRYKDMFQSFIGIKELILTNTRDQFANRYKNNSKDSIYVDGNSNFM